jgi:hypothetical protein
VCRSPWAPRCQVRACSEGRNRSRQPTSAATARPSRPACGSLGGQDLAGEAGGGDQWRPPGQGTGPGGQLQRAPAAVLDHGRAAGASEAAGDRGRRRGGRGRGGLGTPEGVLQWVQGGPAAAQQLGGLVDVGVQEPLELLGVQLPDGQPGALVDRAAELLVLVVVAIEVLVVVVGVLGLAHVLLLKLVAVSRLCCWPRRVG